MSNDDGSSRRTFVTRVAAGVGGLAAGSVALASDSRNAVLRLLGLADDVATARPKPFPDPPSTTGSTTGGDIPRPPIEPLGPVIRNTSDTVVSHLNDTEGMIVHDYQVATITVQELVNQTRKGFCATMNTIGAVEALDEAKQLDDYLQKTWYPISELPWSTQVKMRQNFIYARRAVREAYYGSDVTSTNDRAAIQAGIQEGVCFL